MDPESKDTVMENQTKRKVAVLVSKSKQSAYAVKWTLDRLVSEQDTVVLVHVRPPVLAVPTPLGTCVPVSELREDIVSTYMQQVDLQTYDLLQPYQLLCHKQQVSSEIKVLTDYNVPAAIVEYVSASHINELVIGSSSNALKRMFMASGIPARVATLSPDFCTVYVVSKGKLCSIKSAVSVSSNSDKRDSSSLSIHASPDEGSHTETLKDNRERGEAATLSSLKMPISNEQGLCGTRDQQYSFEGHSCEGSNVSPMSADMCISISQLSLFDSHPSSANSLCGLHFPWRAFSGSIQDGNGEDFSIPLMKNSVSMIGCSNLGKTNNSRDQRQSCDATNELTPLIEAHSSMSSCLTMSEVADAAQNLEIDVNQFVEKCKQASKKETVTKLEVAKEMHKNGCTALLNRDILEAIEQKVGMSRGDTKTDIDCKRPSDFIDIGETVERTTSGDQSVIDKRFKQYSLQEIEQATDFFAESLKIGEGSYGSVYKCVLDERLAAVKVLHPDAAQGWKQFKQEVEVLSSMQHAHIVMLLGVCAEAGCLVYEYMENGNLEDRLFRKGATPPIPWRTRFRIASEIATGLFFLHSSKPKPLAHRDLKPANILLDENFTSKIGDAGLAKLASADLPGQMTQTEFQNTTTSGTFCYIDPEYQQTGVLGTKSDLYAFGVVLLQLLTAKQPMGLAYKVERAIDKGSFKDMLDQTVKDWPMKETLDLAKLALKCVELRRRDRPDLETVVLPELQRLRSFAVQFHEQGQEGNLEGKVSNVKRLWSVCRKIMLSSKDRSACGCYGPRDVAP